MKQLEHNTSQWRFPSDLALPIGVPGQHLTYSPYTVVLSTAKKVALRTRSTPTR